MFTPIVKLGVMNTPGKIIEFTRLTTLEITGRETRKRERLKTEKKKSHY